MAKLSLAKGTTSKLVQVYIQDSTKSDGTGLTGLTYASASLVWWYYREGAASAASIAAASMVTGSWTSGGLAEIHTASMPGLYQLGLPDATLVTGANSVVHMLRGAANMVPTLLEIELTGNDNQISGMSSSALTEITTSTSAHSASTTASAVWTYATRALTDKVNFGLSGSALQEIGASTIAGSNAASAVWNYATRALTDKATFGISASAVTDVWAAGTRALTDKVNFGISTSALTEITNSTSAHSASQSASSVWTYATRALTDKVNFGVSGSALQEIGASTTAGSTTASAVWTYATRALTDKATFGISASAVTDVWAATTRSLTDKTNYGLSGSALQEIGASTIAGSTNASAVWTYATRALTDKVNFGVSTSALNEITTNTLSASGVWQSATRTLTDKVNFGVSTSALNEIVSSTSAHSASQSASSVWTYATRTITDKTNYGLSTSALGEISSSLTAIGTPVALSGGTATLAGMLVKMADDNNGATFSSTTDSLNKLASKVVTGVPDNVTAGSSAVTTGSNISSNYTNTYLSNGTYWIVSPSTVSSSGYGLDAYLGYALSSGQKVNKVSISGYYNSAANHWVHVNAYNWSTSAWDQLSDSVTRMNNASVNTAYSYNLLSSHQSASNTVRIGFRSADTNTGYRLNLDQVLVQIATAGATVSDIADAVYIKMRDTVYEGGVWIDTNAGVAGTDIGIHGVPWNPVSNYNDALTIASTLGVKRFYLRPASSIILNQDHTGWRFIGYGDIDLNGQIIEDAVFENCYEITGTGVGDDMRFVGCGLGNLTLDHFYAESCMVKGTINLNAAGAEKQFYLHNCSDAVSGGTSIFTFISSANELYLRNWRGGVQLASMASGESAFVDGAGRVITGSDCALGSTITIRGQFTITDNVPGGYLGTLTDSARWAEDQSMAYITGGLSTSALNDVSIRSASGVWNNATRTLTDKANFGVSASAVTDVWAAGTRTLTDKTNYGISTSALNEIATNTVAASTVWQNSTRSLTDKVNFGVSTSALNEITTSTSAHSASQSASAIWTYATRAITDKTNYGLSGSALQEIGASTTSGSTNASAVWTYATRSLTDKVGFGISASAVDDIWDESQVSHTGALTFGKYLDAQVSGISAGSTSGGTSIAASDVWAYGARSLTDKVNFGISTSAIGEITSSTSAHSASTTASAVWTYATRALVDKVNFGVSTSAINEIVTNTLAASTVWLNSTRTLSDKTNYGLSGSALGEISSSLQSAGAAASDVWAYGTRVLTDKTNFGISTSAINEIKTNTLAASTVWNSPTRSLTDKTNYGISGSALIEIAAGNIPASDIWNYVTRSLTVTDKTGYKLASDGLDTISMTSPSGVAGNFRELVIQTWKRFFGKSTLTSTELKTYDDSGISVLTTQSVSDNGTIQTLEKSS